MSFTSVQAKLNSNRRENCFELFGMDFMIDEDGLVWLIEVNTNPCLSLSSPLLKMLIPRMVDDALRLTVDVLFPPPPQPRKELYGVTGYKDNENMWIKIV